MGNEEWLLRETVCLLAVSFFAVRQKRSSLLILKNLHKGITFYEGPHVSGFLLLGWKKKIELLLLVFGCLRSRQKMNNKKISIPCHDGEWAWVRPDLRHGSGHDLERSPGMTWLWGYSCLGGKAKQVLEYCPSMVEPGHSPARDMFFLWTPLLALSSTDSVGLSRSVIRTQNFFAQKKYWEWHVGYMPLLLLMLKC